MQVLFIITILFFGPTCSQAEEFLTQKQTEELAAQIMRKGADQSLQASATGAMQALTKIRTVDIPGAVSTAYKAYGQFKNSEHLDQMQKAMILSKATMTSLDTFKISPEDAAILGARTSYRRLDPAFLKTGEAAKIAEDFERTTGIKRDDFLKQLASFSESNLFSDDPNLVNKITSGIDSFIAKIPNQDFRKKIKSAFSMIPSTTREKLLVQSVRNGDKLNAAGISNQELAKSVDKGKATSEAQISNPGDTQNTPGRKETSVKNEDEFKFYSDLGPPSYVLHEEEANQLSTSELVDSAINNSENKSLFDRISQRYRQISPSLKY